MLIDADPLMPYLAALEKAEAELASSDAEFAALSKSEKRAQVDGFLARDEATQKAFDEARRMIIATLRLAVAHHSN